MISDFDYFHDINIKVWQFIKNQAKITVLCFFLRPLFLAPGEPYKELKSG